MVHIVKLYYESSGKEQEIRRLTVTSDIVSNFVLLLERVRSAFQIPCTENVQLKWRDPENDLIVMSSNEELAQALANAEEGLLRIYVSSKEEKSESAKCVCPKEGKPESANIPKRVTVGDYHCYVVCDGCDGEVFGDRYKCMQCKDYDLCSTCNAAGTHANHDMLKLVKPISVNRDWLLPGAGYLQKHLFISNASRDTVLTVKWLTESDEKNISDKLNADVQGNCNTVPKSAPSSSTDNVPNATSSQQKEKNPPNPSFTDQCPFDPATLFPKVSDCLQKEFGFSQKLMHQGLNQVLKVIQGSIEMVDNSLKVAEQATNANKSGTPTSSTPTQATESSSTSSVPTQATESTPAEVRSEHLQKPVFPSKPTTSENVDVLAENNKSSENEGMVEGAGELFIDIEPEKCTNPTEEAASADGWTLLEGGDDKKMECTAEGAAANVTEKEVVYPDLMEVESNQESNNNSTQCTDPVILSALVTMGAMGFTNEGGWLERLLVSKEGNINEALEALYPSIHR